MDRHELRLAHNSCCFDCNKEPREPTIMATQSLVPMSISSKTLDHRMQGPRKIDTATTGVTLQTLERRNWRRREALQHAANSAAKESSSCALHLVVKAKSAITTVNKSTGPMRPIFQRSKITDPLIVARNNTSMVSIESATSVETLLDDADEEQRESGIEKSIATTTIAEGEKKVRFCVDEKGDILPNYLPSKGSRWFDKPAEGAGCISQHEFRLIVNDARHYVKMIRTECPEMVSILSNMFQDEGLAAGLLSDHDAGILKLWSSSLGRGLEDHLVPEVKTHRNNARTRILKLQEKMVRC